MIVRNENQTLENFLSRCHRNISLIYNINNELMDKNKSLKEHGFYNNDKLRFTGGGMYYSGYFNENKFFNKVVLSDLIDEQKNNIFKIYSPSRMQHREIRENEDIQFDIIGSNIGPVFGGKDGRYSLDSNIAKAAVFEGKVGIGEKAVIFLKISRNNNIFEGDERNGIKTSDFRYVSDFCFIFTNKVSSEDYYHPKTYLIKK
jgi:hypothetical protein